MIRMISMTGILFVTLSSSMLAFSQKADFSGFWHLNKSKTDFKQAPEYILPRTLEVKETGTTMTIVRTQLTTQLEEKQYAETINLDGKTSQTTTISGNNEYDSVDQHTNSTNLTIGMNILKPDNSLVTTVSERWSLTNGGKTLVIDRHVHQFNGMDYDITAYFDKQ